VIAWSGLKQGAAIGPTGLIESCLFSPALEPDSKQNAPRLSANAKTRGLVGFFINRVNKRLSAAAD